jgi:hypothetical protein
VTDIEEDINMSFLQRKEIGLMSNKDNLPPGGGKGGNR